MAFKDSMVHTDLVSTCVFVSPPHTLQTSTRKFWLQGWWQHLITV